MQREKILLPNYYEQKLAEAAANNENGEAGILDMINAAKSAADILRTAESYTVLTEGEIKTYTVKVNGENKLMLAGNRAFAERYNREILGKVEVEIAALKKAGIQDLTIAGFLAYFLRDSSKYRGTSAFEKYQGQTRVAERYENGKYSAPYFHEAYHNGFDAAAAPRGVDSATTQSEDYDVSSIFFTEVVTEEKDREGRVTLSVMGTDIHVSMLHLDPADIANTNSSGFFNPGDTIVKYPEKNRGSGNGAHIHFEVTRGGNTPATRYFVDPRTLQQAPQDTKFKFRQGRIIRKRITKAQYSMLRHDAESNVSGGFDGSEYYIGSGYSYSKDTHGSAVGFEENFDMPTGAEWEDDEFVLWGRWIDDRPR